MHGHGGLIPALFAFANAAIAGGYLAAPFLFLRYLPLTLKVKVYGAGMFVGCAGSHLWMVASMTGHGRGFTFWTVWHLIQAGFTWALLFGFRAMLKAAQARRAGQP